MIASKYSKEEKSDQRKKGKEGKGHCPKPSPEVSTKVDHAAKRKHKISTRGFQKEDHEIHLTKRTKRRDKWEKRNWKDKKERKEKQRGQYQEQE